jgi:uncharacterized membrane-anchored protein YhcB (DUF1043 family)
VPAVSVLTLIATLINPMLGFIFTVIVLAVIMFINYIFSVDVSLEVNIDKVKENLEAVKEEANEEQITILNEKTADFTDDQYRAVAIYCGIFVGEISTRVGEYNLEQYSLSIKEDSDVYSVVEIIKALDEKTLDK